MTPSEPRPLAVGCRELKTRLGTYMGRVKAGETIIVTERGQPIAELRPLVPGGGLEERLYRLVAQGLVSHEVREPRALEAFRPITSRQPASRALAEDRDDRF
jgi:prevent-host-death family protein